MTRTNKHVAAGILHQTLCTRCGTCSGVCPFAAIWRDDDYYPHLHEDKCTDCGLCASTCPGGILSAQLLQKATFDTEEWPNDYLGHYRSAFAAHSRDEKVRHGGGSGGVVTELLLYLLESKKIDGAIVTGMDADHPTRAKSYIAETPEQIFAARQSKYIVYPSNDVFRLIQKDKRRFAYVGLPCQIQGLRKWMWKKPLVGERIPYVIGLFCLTTFEAPIIQELNALKGDPDKSLQDFRFREGVWPGTICAFYKDGSVKKLHYSNFKDGAINYLTQLYAPYRCQMCTDGTAEFADISVADAWMRKKDKSYRYPSMSTVLVRTAAGQSLFDDAVKDNRLKAYPVEHKILYNTFLTLEKNKKISARLRANRRRRANVAVPVYDEPVPQVTGSDRRHEKKSTFYQSLGRHEGLRKLLIKVLLSKLMIPIIHVRKKRKESRYKD